MNTPSVQSAKQNLILTTPRLILRPILADELSILYRILTDPYVRRYLCDDNILALPAVEAMLMTNQQQFQHEGFGLWFMETQADRTVIGLVGLWYFFDEAQPQLVYALLPIATHRGYATEATGRIVEYSFEALGYGYLVASCDEPNLASQRVATRLGMKLVERRTIEGKPILFFRLDKDEG